MSLIVQINDENAVVPTKAHPSDTGYDLVCIKLKKELENGVRLYDTGISVKPPSGYYTEILPRSSISKSGWMLANSVGVIDSEYRGNLLVALIPVSNSPVNLETPFCLTQLVLRKCEECQIIVGNIEEETERGSGGFGSSGNRVD